MLLVVVTFLSIHNIPKSSSHNSGTAFVTKLLPKPSATLSTAPSSSPSPDMSTPAPPPPPYLSRPSTRLKRPSHSTPRTPPTSSNPLPSTPRDSRPSPSTPFTSHCPFSARRAWLTRSGTMHSSKGQRSSS
ncbi:hypothetical protein DVH24_002534 [Malus domestica]|uniref:Uncharacterized protein n=1 Tax=Malus domestica TaxID=3750 RepID=A0A498IQ19_MALDO|nr:hypothetical protein DVH24_002534 [Malus domestica]